MQHCLSFTEEMKKEYTILAPNMLPMHFSLLAKLLESYGYKVEVLDSCGPEIAETGLRYVHNDTCYPAVIAIGQMIHALQSGRFDADRVALVMFQTGGGCRASNYLPLLYKALDRAGFPQVPVICLGLNHQENSSGLGLGIKQILSMLQAVLYGDLLMTLVNQCRSYEVEKGAAYQLAEKWILRLGQELSNGFALSDKRVRANYREIVKDFAAIPLEKRNNAAKVGIVGEVFVKYSSLANNNIEEFLIENGAEVVMPCFIDVLLSIIYNRIMDYQLYGKGLLQYALFSALYKRVCHMKKALIKAIDDDGTFEALRPFEYTVSMTQGYIGLGMKMGEGWLLPAEILEMIAAGIGSIICVQPFGCLPNHICGRGMFNQIKIKNPSVNLIAIDYDMSAARINQENRLKLLLFASQRLNCSA